MTIYRHTVSAGTISGTAVKNFKDEELGHIEDIMIDLTNGSVAYLVLSYGGIFGTSWNDKRFAVPFTAFQIEGSQNGKDLIYRLSIDKETVEQAPGFQKDQYPDWESPQFHREIEHFYKNLPELRPL